MPEPKLQVSFGCQDLDLLAKFGNSLAKCLLIEFQLLDIKLLIVCDIAWIVGHFQGEVLITNIIPFALMGGVEGILILVEEEIGRSVACC